MNIFSLVASLVLDSKDYEKGLKSAEGSAIDFARNVGGKLGDAVKTVAKVGAAAAAAAGTAITVLTKQVVDSYAEYEQLVGGVETLFKGASDKVKQYADEAYRTVGMSANQYMSSVTGFSASLISSLNGDVNAAADLANVAMQDIADNANTFGKYTVEDLTSVYQALARGQYQTLDNLQLGYSGSKEGMEQLVKDAARLDKSFTYNTKTVKKNGKEVKELNLTYADMVKAIHIVQKNMGITGKTAEEAAKTVSGSLGMLKAAWANLLTGMGEGNRERLSGLIQEVVTSARTAMDNLLPVIENALDGLAQLIGELGPMIANELPRLTQKVLPSAIDAAGKLLEGIFAAVPGIIDKGLPIIIRSVGSLFNGVMKALPALGARFYTYLKEGLLPDIAWAIAEATGGGWEEANSIYHGMTGALDWIVNAFDSVSKRLGEIYDQYIGPMIEDIGGFLSEVIPKVQELTTAIMTDLEMLGEAMAQFYGEGGPGAGFVQWIKDGLIGTWESFKEQCLNILEFLTGIFTLDWERAWNALAAIVMNPFTKIREALRGPINAVIEMLNQLLATGESVINTIVDGINNTLRLTVPGWIPVFGGKSWSPNLNRVEWDRVKPIQAAAYGMGRNGKDRYFAAGGVLSEGQEAWVGEYAPEKLRVVNGRAVVTPTGLPRFDQQPPRPVQIVFEINGDEARRWVYNATEDERQRVGMSLAK